MELALRLHGGDGGTELGHGVELGGKAVDHLHHMLRQTGPAGPVPGDGMHLQGEGEGE